VWLASRDHSDKAYQALFEDLVSAGSGQGRVESYDSDSISVLRALFPTVKQASAEGRFRRKDWNLFSTFESFREGPPCREVCLLPHKGVIELKDSYASWLLQRVFVLDEKLQVSLLRSVSLSKTG
jgi:hypothetical protein